MKIPPSVLAYDLYGIEVHMLSFRHQRLRYNFLLEGAMGKLVDE